MSARQWKKCEVLLWRYQILGFNSSKVSIAYDANVVRFRSIKIWQIAAPKKRRGISNRRFRRNTQIEIKSLLKRRGDAAILTGSRIPLSRSSLRLSAFICGFKFVSFVAYAAFSLMRRTVASSSSSISGYRPTSGLTKKLSCRSSLAVDTSPIMHSPETG
jgi:hypothetical protein